MDVLKDRMYCDATDSLSRRSCQTAMYKILDSMIKMLAPILAHTAEEAWAAMKFKSEDVETVHLSHMPKPDGTIDWQSQQNKWEKIMSLRDQIMRALEVFAAGKKNRKQPGGRRDNLQRRPGIDQYIKRIRAGSIRRVLHCQPSKIAKNAAETSVVAEKSSSSEMSALLELLANRRNRQQLCRFVQPMCSGDY